MQPRLLLFFFVFAFVVIVILQGVATVDEPVKASWNYSPEQIRPFWENEVMEGESVLFIKDSQTGEARASVLFPIKEVLTVRNSAGDITYENGRDYKWNLGSRELVLPPGSRIVSRTPSELRRPAKSQQFALMHRDGNDEIYFGAKLEYHEIQTCITYSHAPNLWENDVPKFDATALPRVLSKLQNRQPVSIVVIGDSISTGCNASGWAQGAPYQPPYPDLLRKHLESHYQNHVELVNLSFGGTGASWAVTMVDKIVDAKPDLVIVALGMNDAGGCPASEYKANIEMVIAKIRETLPDTEFILIASMVGNRDWVTLKQELFPQYRDALEELRGPGIALADMTSIWTSLLEHKKDWDLTGNGVNHPNDFGHRLYAQVLSRLLIPKDEGTAKPAP